MMGLPLPIDWKDNSNELILVIMDCLTKIIYYKLIKKIIGIVDLVKVIINIMVKQHSLLKSIVSDKSFLFCSKFWFLPCYFLDIK